MDFVELRGKHESSSLYHRNDGFFYYCYQSYNETLYFRCIEWKRGCLVRGKLRGGNFTLSNVHSHIADFSKAANMTDRHGLIQEARRLDIASFREIFENRPDGNEPNGQRLTLHQLQPAMARARMQMLPQPECMAQLIEVLNNPTFSCITATTHFSDNVFKGSAQAPDESHVVLFMSRTCHDFISLVPSLFIIKTQVTLKNQQNQLIVLGSLWERDAVLLAWLLVERVSHESLVAAFTLLRSSIVTYHFATVICGVPNISQAFQEVFQMNVLPSLYDFIGELKAFVDDAIGLGDVHQIEAMKQVISLSCALPLLPTYMQQIGVNFIANVANCQPPGIQNYCRTLFNFMDEKLHSPTFSVFGSVERTHFMSEQLRQQLLQHLPPNSNLPFYAITRYIVSNEEKTKKKILRIYEGRRLEPKVPHPLTNDQNLTNIVQSGAFDLQNQVKCLLESAVGKICHLI